MASEFGSYRLLQMDTLPQSHVPFILYVCVCVRLIMFYVLISNIVYSLNLSGNLFLLPSRHIGRSCLMMNSSYALYTVSCLIETAYRAYLSM